MSKPIQWIIDGWSYWDKLNGNSYPLTRVTHTTTGNSLILDECTGNVRSLIHNMERARTGNAWTFARIHESPVQEISGRTWRTMRHSSSHAPATVYKRTGKTPRSRLVNITTQLLNQLRIKSK